MKELPLRILYLENNPKDAKLVRSELSTEGLACDVVAIETRAEFLAALEEGEFDLIFLDCEFSSFDGMEVLAMAKEKCPDVPSIIITGTLAEERAIEGLRSGATDYVIKERLSKLVPVVRRVLGEVEDRAELKRSQKKLLLAVKRAEKVEEILCSTVDATVAELMLEKRLVTEKRRISVLFADLKDFAQHSEKRKPETVITELNRLFQKVEAVFFDYHAHVDKYLGGGIMVEFGAPLGYERHALLAVLAGLKIQQQIAEEKFPLKMRIGIATGESITGLIGHRRQSYTAVGEVVSWASKITKMCTPARVTVNDATYQEVRRFLEARRRTVFFSNESDDPELVKKITRCLTLLDGKPDEVEVLKEAGLLLMEGHYVSFAHEHLGKALQIDPQDKEMKLAYAEATLKMNQTDGTSIGSDHSIFYLYEILGLKNPLSDRERIPPKLYEEYRERVEKALNYPQDMVLPVEAIDGSVGHSRVVGFLSYALADQLNLTEKEKRQILEAGYLADIGKAVVPHYLLNRPGILSAEEFQEVVKHPRESVRRLRKMGYQDNSVFEIIESAHENLNGSGYPSGLAGEEIPLGSRIVAVADAYAGLTSWRPYRSRWEYRAACAEMRRDTRKGKFDPKVVKVFESLLQI